MNKEFLFTVLGISILLWWASTYFLDIIRWQTIPHPYSYILWSILVGFNTYVLFTLSEWYSFAQGVINVLVCLIFSIMWLYYIHKIQRNWFDTFCLILAWWMFVYWYWTRNITNTVIITIIIDFVSCLPTLKKIWIQPWSETVKVYISSIIIASLTLITLDVMDINIIFWIYLIIINILIVWFAIGRRYYLKWWKSIFE